MCEELPDTKIPWWDNEYEGVYSEDPEDGYPYDVGTKVQEWLKIEYIIGLAPSCLILFVEKRSHMPLSGTHGKIITMISKKESQYGIGLQKLYWLNYRI